MKLNELPSDIVRIVKERYKERYKLDLPEEFEGIDLSGIIVFLDTIEGNIWDDVNGGNYESFYAFHNIIPTSINNYEIY